MQNHVVWVSMPVSDLERASKFYAHVVGQPVVEPPGMEGVALVGMPPAPGDAVPEYPLVSFNLFMGASPARQGPTYT